MGPDSMCLWSLLLDTCELLSLCLSGESPCICAWLCFPLSHQGFQVAVFKFSSFSTSLWNECFSNAFWSMYWNKQKHVLCLVPQRRKGFLAQNQPKCFVRAHLTFMESPPSLAPFPSSLWSSCSSYGWPELSLAQSTVCFQHHCCLQIYKVGF